MGWQIVKQPDGQYAIWSTFVDDFINTDLSKEQIRWHYLQKLKQDFEQKIKDQKNHIEEIFKGLDEDTAPYYQFTMTLDQCVDIFAANHPKQKDEAIQYRKHFGLSDV